MKNILYTILACCIGDLFYSCSCDSIEVPNEGKDNVVLVQITMFLLSAILIME